MIRNAKMAIVVSLSYFDFDDLNKMLEELDPEIHYVKSIPGFPTSKLSKAAQILNFKIVHEMTNFLADCPIRYSIPITVDESFVPIVWPCPESVRNSESLETSESCFPYLYMYALVILVQKFRIPIYSVSIFESTIDESVVWSETIGFMNFMIEKMGSLIHLETEKLKLFKFVDAIEN